MTTHWLYAPNQRPQKHPRIGRGPVFSLAAFEQLGIDPADVTAANAPDADPDAIDHAYVGFWPLVKELPPGPVEEHGDYERRGFTFTGTLGDDGEARPNWVGPIPWRTAQRLEIQAREERLGELPALVTAVNNSNLPPVAKQAFRQIIKILADLTTLPGPE